ncbi:MAG: prepilin-type N-terminal cleavage/methylation domain-containing protein [Alphaproteobacteria bacterium]
MAERRASPLGAAGFTLLEVLVALALLALVSAMLAGGIRFGARAWEAQDERLAAASELDAVRSLVRQLIAAGEPLALAGVGPESAPLYLDGRRDSITLVTDLPEALAGRDLYDATLTLASAGRLVLRWRPHLRKPEVGAAAPWTETEMLRGVAAIDLQYYAPASEDEPGRWLADWRQPAALPALVRMRLSFAPGDRRRWTELVAALPITAP